MMAALPGEGPRRRPGFGCFGRLVDGRNREEWFILKRGRALAFSGSEARGTRQSPAQTPPPGSHRGRWGGWGLGGSRPHHPGSSRSSRRAIFLPAPGGPRTWASCPMGGRSLSRGNLAERVKPGRWVIGPLEELWTLSEASSGRAPSGSPPTTTTGARGHCPERGQSPSPPRHPYDLGHPPMIAVTVITVRGAADSPQCTTAGDF